ncbi:CDGSH iron-sulfur domain-containing protein [Microbacterium lushaniae]|nr:CDGSH iron-sulfur domain-containing protein [Microbacterium lushaniae]KAA9153148.1 CDGSH iron-sulfur domain-containing protein [Microbacterium lushaniae]
MGAVGILPAGPAVTDDRVTITAYPDGPLLLRGDVDLRTADGRPIPRARRTVALCRCGLSAIKPFCDGTHKAAGFRTED